MKSISVPHGEMKLIFTGKFHCYCLTFIVLGGTAGGARDGQSYPAVSTGNSTQDWPAKTCPLVQKWLECYGSYPYMTNSKATWSSEYITATIMGTIGGG